MAEENKTNETTVEILEDGDEIITLYDDNNNPVDFFQIAAVEYEGEFYAIMEPCEILEGMADDECIVFKVIEEDEENDLFIIEENDDIADAVIGLYNAEIDKEMDEEE